MCVLLIVAVGPECTFIQPSGVNPDNYETFADYKAQLQYSCETENPEPAVLTVTPNSTWPDTVYYQVDVCASSRGEGWGGCRRRHDVITPT